MVGGQNGEEIGVILLPPRIVGLKIQTWHLGVSKRWEARPRLVMNLPFRISIDIWLPSPGSTNRARRLS